MGPMIKFLQAVRNLSKQGVKKEDIYKAAQREFGEMSELLKRQIDDIYNRFKAPGPKSKSEIGDFFGFKNYPKKAEKKKAEVVPFKKKDDDVVELKKERPQAKEEFEKMLDETFPEMQSKNVLKGEEIGEKNLETFIKSDEEREFLGFPSRAQEALVRAAAREVLSQAGFGFRIGRQDPIQMARQIFGDEVLFALDNITDELSQVGSAPQLTKVLDETGILERFSKPREGLNVEEKGQIEDLTKFDPEGREPNQSGGLAGILGV